MCTKSEGLYRSEFEHDACGIGAIASIKGEKTHKVVEDALNILMRLEHRGGIGAERNSGDGAGLLCQIPHEFFKEACIKDNIALPDEGCYGVANMFIPDDNHKFNEFMKIFTEEVEAKNCYILGTRDVPVNSSSLGKTSLESMPNFIQIFVSKSDKIKPGIEFERVLYRIRRITEKRLIKLEGFNKETVYFESFSSKTIVYKGMLLSTQLRDFYKDITDESFKSAIALVHSRFSTNTFPSWSKAHPNRLMIHNGEINTIKGNSNWISTREGTLHSSVMNDSLSDVLPVINDMSGSDSAMMDNTLEFLMMNGRELPEAVMMLIPEPWQKSNSMNKDKADYYKYHATVMEPWDGPAAIVFTDGEKMGAVLDRNGLRPARYYVTDDDYLILSSEVGVLDIDEEHIVKKERLQPGKMLLVDTVKKQLIDDEELKMDYAKRYPYNEWLEENLLTLDKIKSIEEVESVEKIVFHQKLFGYHLEDIESTIIPMCKNGKEPIGAMGIDTPLAILSEKPQNLFSYFKQMFAQVTNPPIDAIREEIVTGTDMYLGSEGNMIEDKPENCKQLMIDSPIINNSDMRKIKSLNKDSLKTGIISCVYKNDNSKGMLERALEGIFSKADKMIDEGYSILVLSDREADENNVPIPSLLAVSSLHHYLINNHKRTKISIICESGEPREVHHLATLIGYGASAVNPYMVYETIKDLVDKEKIDISFDDAVKNFNNASIKGIVNILAKMGISTIQSYHGSQIFEAIGLNKEFIDKYFTGTVSTIQGIGIEEVQKEYLIIHENACDKNSSQDKLEYDGSIKFKVGKEEHIYNPKVIRLLQASTRTGDYEMFKEYSKLLNQDQSYVNLRGVLDFKRDENKISIDEVESVDSIVKRFKTGAMSYGSISKEAHEALALAMNKIGGKSNTGEGGEDKERLESKWTSKDYCSSIKQVASGRFGVTSEYLLSAEEIQIKMAQGAKPGEGGHLPGNKVYPWIAKTRHSTTGVSLISPPPHHDIYSIEDLAQLIYDLKNANEKANISVKLVSEAGVGTVAAGVAKGGAESILVSGFDGGTGAASRTGIKNAGLPWELGLAETNQTLIKNNLRGRVKLETDGKLMTGRDVAIAALLGAEEFSFATAPLVTLGCVMARVCNLNTCPVGIATQDEELRKRFKGKPEYVMNFMRFVAEELREYMAELGFRTVDEMIGRCDKLKQKEDIKCWKAETLDLSDVLYKINPEEGRSNKYDIKESYDFDLDSTLDKREFIDDAKISLDFGTSVKLYYNIKNTDRAIGTLLGSEITKKHKDGLPDDTIELVLKGTGGQSLGAFIPKGLTIELEGDINDYAGKGLSGGKIIAYPNKKSKLKAEENVIVGNVALYGATSGEAYFNGIAGERFAVRNSGAFAVVEGVGEHGCEYMTGGKVVILGQIGKNFAAGMSGGIAFIYDDHNNAVDNINKELVNIEKLNSSDMEDVKRLVNNHYLNTNSSLAKKILDSFNEESEKFIKIMPKDYEAIIELIEENKKKGMTQYDAEMEAFNMSKN